VVIASLADVTVTLPTSPAVLQGRAVRYRITANVNLGGTTTGAVILESALTNSESAIDIRFGITPMNTVVLTDTYRTVLDVVFDAPPLVFRNRDSPQTSNLYVRFYNRTGVTTTFTFTIDGYGD